VRSKAIRQIRSNKSEKHPVQRPEQRDDRMPSTPSRL
jgi:hypothetical protein